MLSNDRSIELIFHFFHFLFFLISCWAFIPIQVPVSFKLFVESIFCLFLTCVYHIYFIIVHWSWKLSLGAISNFRWAVSKPDIRSCFSHMLVKFRGEGCGFCGCTYLNQYIDWLQVSSSSYSKLNFIGKCCLKVQKGPLVL